MMAYACVRVIFEIGHEAVIRNKKTPEGFTHDWELFVRGAENTDIHHFIDRVVFYLHDTFQNPRRVCKEPPYVVRESGYAGFTVPVEIYFKNKTDPHKIRFKYPLTLQDSGPPISNVIREKYVFNNPSEDFRRKLIKGGGIGVGTDCGSETNSHLIHAAASSSNYSNDEQKNLSNSRSKSSHQESAIVKKSLKENTSKHEEQLQASDPFAIFGQPIKTSNILVVPKCNLKQQIPEKVTQSRKQAYVSKSPKHISSSHAKTKDQSREKEKEKEKIKEPEKDKEKILVKKSKDESLKKEKVKEMKPSKIDSKKNMSPDDKIKEKLFNKIETEIKIEKKDKVKKSKEEKKLKSKDKYKMNEKKDRDNFEENYAEVKEKIGYPDEEISKEEKKKFKSGTTDKSDKTEKISKEKSFETMSLCTNNDNEKDLIVNQPIMDSDKHNKHVKHKKDKSKKDLKKDKSEKKEKMKESKENREKSVLKSDDYHKFLPKLENSKRLKKPLKTLFEELTDKSDTDMSSVEEDSLKQSSKNSNFSEIAPPVKDEPIVFIGQENEIKEEKFVESNSKKKDEKYTEEKESKKRKQKLKAREENISYKISKYENSPTKFPSKSNTLIGLQEQNTESKQSLRLQDSDLKFTDEYISKLKELQQKIMNLEDNSGLQRIVQVVAETGQYEITTKTFDFDLCMLDEAIVQRLLDFFVP